MKLQGAGGGGGRRRARKTAGACGVTHPPRKAAGGIAPQDRRRLTFFWGAETRRSRLWSLKSVLDVLRVPAARPGTRHFRAEHVGAVRVRVRGRRAQGSAAPPLLAPGPLQFQGVAGVTVPPRPRLFGYMLRAEMPCSGPGCRHPKYIKHRFQ